MNKDDSQRVNLSEPLKIMVIHTIGLVLAFGVMNLIFLIAIGFGKGFESITDFDTFANNIMAIINYMMPVSLISSAIIIIAGLKKLKHINTNTERDKITLDIISGINKANVVWIAYNIMSVLLVALTYVYGDGTISQVRFELLITTPLWVPAAISLLILNLKVKKRISIKN